MSIVSVESSIRALEDIIAHRHETYRCPIVRLEVRDREYCASAPARYRCHGAKLVGGGDDDYAIQVQARCDLAASAQTVQS